MAFDHVPVLIDRVIECLELKEGALVVDGTLGLGGYSERFLSHDKSWKVVGIDKDKNARDIASVRLAPFGERFTAIPGDFRDIKELCSKSGIQEADAVVLDLGVSNMQLVDSARGFSFKNDGPLDMRMDRDGGGMSAYDMVNGLPRESLANIFRKYGEERFAWQIAGEIVKAREKAPIETTTSLTGVIRRGIPAPVARKMGGHPARKVFQALRIAVNDELGALESGIKGAFDLLAEDGILLVVTYHSLEDRIVKHAFREWSEAGHGILSPRKSIVPDEEEVERNPKSRSARLRGFQKKKVDFPEGRLGPWRRF